MALVDGPEQLTVEDADNPHGDGLVITLPKVAGTTRRGKLVGRRLGVHSPVEFRTLTLLPHLSNLFGLDNRNKKI